jgi:hypothetical protein
MSRRNRRPGDTSTGSIEGSNDRTGNGAQVVAPIHQRGP